MAASSSSSSHSANGKLPFHGFTLEETLELLNDELHLLGIPRIDQVQTSSSLSSTKSVRPTRGRGDDVGVSVADVDGVGQLLQTVFQLIDLQRRNVVTIDDLESEKKAFRGEKEKLNRQLQQTQQQSAALKQATSEAKEKERRAEVKVKDLAKMLHAEREEKKKLFQVSG